MRGAVHTEECLPRPSVRRSLNLTGDPTPKEPLLDGHETSSIVDERELSLGENRHPHPTRPAEETLRRVVRVSRLVDPPTLPARRRDGLSRCDSGRCCTGR